MSEIGFNDADVIPPIQPGFSSPAPTTPTRFPGGSDLVNVDPEILEAWLAANFTPEERAAWEAAFAEQIANLEAEADVIRAEQLLRAEALESGADVDGDGVVSDAELATYEADVARGGPVLSSAEAGALLKEVNYKRQKDDPDDAFEGKSKQEILDYIDPKHISLEELQKIADEEGYTLSDKDIRDLTGALPQIDDDEPFYDGNGDFVGMKQIERQQTQYEFLAPQQGKFDQEATTLGELKRIAEDEGVDLSGLTDDEIEAQYEGMLGNVTEKANYEALDKLGTNVQDVQDAIGFYLIPHDGIPHGAMWHHLNLIQSNQEGVQLSLQ